jgi:hypothetical protein
VRADSARAWRRLAQRADVALAAACALPADRVRAVGGAVRDAFLGRSGGDLDLSVAAGKADAFAGRLAARTRTRVVPVGAAPKRILKVRFRTREIDVWEEESDADADLVRRDFTVNAIAFSLPDGRLAAAPGALADLAARRLAPPRPGVFLEDSLRVLRAARFLAELPGFHVTRAAFPELRDAAKMLRMVAPERRLVELDKLLGARKRCASSKASAHCPSSFKARRRERAAAVSLSSFGFARPTRASPEPFSCCRWVRKKPEIFLEGGKPAGRSRGWQAGCSRCRSAGKKGWERRECTAALPAS